MKNVTFALYVLDGKKRQMVGIVADNIPLWIMREFRERFAEVSQEAFDGAALMTDQQLLDTATAQGVVPSAQIPIATDGTCLELRLIQLSEYTLAMHVVMEFARYRSKLLTWKKERRLRQAEARQRKRYCLEYIHRNSPISGISFSEYRRLRKEALADYAQDQQEMRLQRKNTNLVE